jgi:hypothetical protein
MVAAHCWRYSVSPGKTGKPSRTGGDMSHKRFIGRSYAAISMASAFS